MNEHEERKRQELHTMIRIGIDQADRGELIPADEVFRRLEARAKSIEESLRDEA